MNIQRIVENTKLAFGGTLLEDSQMVRLAELMVESRTLGTRTMYDLMHDFPKMSEGLFQALKSEIADERANNRPEVQMTYQEARERRILMTTSNGRTVSRRW